MIEPEVSEIKNGWAARAAGWAVHGATKDEAVRRFHEATELRQKIKLQTKNEADGNSVRSMEALSAH